MPIRWAPVPVGYEIPQTIQRVQIFQPKSSPKNINLANNYATDGLFGLMRVGETRAYDETVWQIAKKIQELYYNRRVDPLPAKADDLVDLFDGGSKQES